MIYKEITVTKRYCTGEYEFDEIKVVVEVETFDKDYAAQAIRKALDEIIESRKEKEEEKKNRKTNNPKNSNKGSKSSSEKDSGDDDESDKDHESPDSQISDDSDDTPEESESDSQESDAEENEEETKPSKSKAGAKSPKDEKVKKFKKKPQHYDRGVEAHKEIFSRTLGSLAPDWKKSDKSKTAAKKASENLEGEPFLDENGDVLEGFKTKLRKLMK